MRKFLPTEKNRFYSIGYNRGIAAKEEVISAINAALEGKISARINRYSSKVVPAEIDLNTISERSADNGSSFIGTGSGTEYEKIIQRRASAEQNIAAARKQAGKASLIRTCKIYLVKLERYTGKVERKSDALYQQFLLGAAKKGSTAHNEKGICFKSIVFSDYKKSLEEVMSR